MVPSVLSSKRIIVIAGILLMGIGIGAIVYYGAGMFDTFREIRFAHMHHFYGNNPDTSVVRPWMSVGFVSSAYHIPQEYLFRRIGVPMTESNSVLSFRLLSDQYHFGSGDNLFMLLDKVRKAIDLYRMRFPPPPQMYGSGGDLRRLGGSGSTPQPSHD